MKRPRKTDMLAIKGAEWGGYEKENKSKAKARSEINSLHTQGSMHTGRDQEYRPFISV